MKQTFYLKVNKTGALPKATAKRPHVAPFEAAILIALEIPDAYFMRPSLSAKIEVPDPKTPLNISAATKADAEEAIREATGMNVSLEIVYPESKE